MEEYRHFRLEEVAEGIWAAVGNVNAAIVDLGDQTLIFDTLVDLGSARDLRLAAERLTGRPTTYVVNSHYHADHVQGNLLFADHAVIIASTVTREAMAERGAGALGRMRAGLEGRAEYIRQQLDTATDEGERVRLQAELAEFDELFANYPTPADLRLPTLTFERRLTFRGGRRTAHAITFGGAHSPCDALLWLPADQVLCVGDLVIPGSDPILTLGDPENWLPILEQIEALGARRLIPGHGAAVMADEGYAWMRRYLTDLFETAAGILERGEGPGASDQLPVPKGCDPATYRNNLRFVMERQRAAGRTPG